MTIRQVTGTIQCASPSTRGFKKVKICNVADAVAAAKYLTDRGVLCEKCGLNRVAYVNQFHQVCEGCLPPHGEFKEVKGENVFERALCDALRVFAKAEDE